MDASPADRERGAASFGNDAPPRAIVFSSGAKDGERARFFSRDARLARGTSSFVRAAIGGARRSRAF